MKNPRSILERHEAFALIVHQKHDFHMGSCYAGEIREKVGNLIGLL
jgi:hypothetical protein